MKKIVYLLGFITLLASVNSNALIFDSGPYLGGQFGWGRSDVGNGYERLGPLSLNELGGEAWRVYAGYSFTSIFSVETGYSNYPENEYGSKNTVNTFAIDLVGKATLPLEKLAEPLSRFSIYGKAGVAFSKTNTDLKTASITKSNSAIVPAYGAGIVFNFTDSFAADLSWSGILGRDHIDRSDALDAKNPVPTCNMFTLGLSYKFTGIL